jgi:GntR family transcriptional regulator
MDLDADTKPDFRPLYGQVKDLMIQRLVSGEWRPGALLPSENRLAETFMVSQGTVRKALDELAAENLVVRRQGKGTFVATHTAHRALFHFFHLVDQDDHRQLPDSQLLSSVRKSATPQERTNLGLVAGAGVIRVRRVRLLNGHPTIIEKIVVSSDVFPGLGQSSGNALPNSLYQLYEEKYGVIIHRAIEHLRAVKATRQDAKALGIAPDLPLLEIDRIALSLDRRPVEWRVSRCDTRYHDYLSILD